VQFVPQPPPKRPPTCSASTLGGTPLTRPDRKKPVRVHTSKWHNPLGNARLNHGRHLCSGSFARPRSDLCSNARILAETDAPLVSRKANNSLPRRAADTTNVVDVTQQDYCDS